MAEQHGLYVLVLFGFARIFNEWLMTEVMH